MQPKWRDAMSTPDLAKPASPEEALKKPVSTTTTPDGEVATHPTDLTAQAPTEKRPKTTRKWWLWIAGAVALLAALIAGVPWVVKALTTVSTDDAYVNGHVT